MLHVATISKFSDTLPLLSPAGGTAECPIGIVLLEEADTAAFCLSSVQSNV